MKLPPITEARRGTFVASGPAQNTTVAELHGEIERLRHELVEAHYRVYHDALTGLPNRALLLDRLEQAIARASRQHTRIGVLVLDLDDFKGVNDRFGHRAGDQLLQQVAHRLSASVRANDTACRYGGDEFVIMLPDLAPAVDLNAVAETIRDRMEAQYLLDGKLVGVTASIGIAEFDLSGDPSGSDLLRRADEAMYRSKRSRARGARPAYVLSRRDPAFRAAPRSAASPGRGRARM